jgi:CheY-like chemotaxis protein
MQIIVASADKEASVGIIKALKSLQFTNVNLVNDGINIVREIKESKRKVDFLLCDQNINYIPGWLLIKEIKVSDSVPNIPVILFGKDNQPADDAELKQYGVVKYIKFPSSVSDVSFTINSTLQLFNTSGTIENKFTKAKDALLKENTAAAVEMYEELRGLTKKSTRSSLGLAHAHTKAQDTDKARDIMREVAESGDTTPASLLIMAKVELGSGDGNKATEIVHKLIASMPDAFYYPKLSAKKLLPRTSNFLSSISVYLNVSIPKMNSISHWKSSPQRKNALASPTNCSTSKGYV